MGFEERRNIIAFKNIAEIAEATMYLELKKQMGQLCKAFDLVLEGDTKGFPKWLTKIGEGITVYPLFPGRDGFELYEKGRILRVKEGSGGQLIRERIKNIKEYIGSTNTIIRSLNGFEDPVKPYPIGNNKKIG